MKQKNSYTKKGFTIIELLVVVLTIGILASIALPQYQKIVAKSKYSTLKNLTKSIADSVDRYYLIHNTYPQSYKDLDFDFIVKSSSDAVNFGFTLNDDTNCNVWGDGQRIVACFKNISKKKMGFYFSLRTRRPFLCYTDSTTKTHITNKVCQEETKKQTGVISGGYSLYSY